MMRFQLNGFDVLMVVLVLQLLWIISRLISIAHGIWSAVEVLRAIYKKLPYPRDWDAGAG